MKSEDYKKLSSNEHKLLGKWEPLLRNLPNDYSWEMIVKAAYELEETWENNSPKLDNSGSPNLHHMGDGSIITERHMILPNIINKLIDEWENPKGDNAIKRIIMDIDLFKKEGTWEKRPQWAEKLSVRLIQFDASYVINRALELIAFYLAKEAGLFKFDANNQIHWAMVKDLQDIGLDVYNSDGGLDDKLKSTSQYKSPTSVVEHGPRFDKDGNPLKNTCVGCGIKTKGMVHCPECLRKLGETAKNMLDKINLGDSNYDKK